MKASTDVSSRDQQVFCVSTELLTRKATSLLKQSMVMRSSSQLRIRAKVTKRGTILSLKVDRLLCDQLSSPLPAVDQRHNLLSAIHSSLQQSPVYCIVSALLRCAQYNGLCSGGGTGLRYQVSSSRTEYAPFQTHHSIPSCSDDGDNPGNGDFYYLPAMLIADGYWANLIIIVLNLTKNSRKVLNSVSF